MWLPRGNTCLNIIGTQSHQPVMTDEGVSVITTTSRTSSEISWWQISSPFDLNDMRVHTTFTEIKPRVISISDLSICRPQLIGCCLETPIPILAFESVEYGNLRDRILSASQPQTEPLLMKHRLKIAMDIAHALAYLHFGFPRPIVYRDFKTAHILFNEENVAKMFDFSLSISIPEGGTSGAKCLKSERTEICCVRENKA
ncbi:hypothetical protein WN943_007794 [Citrus x changshan-huyou]